MQCLALRVYRKEQNMKLDTICIQGGYKPKSGEPRVVPIAQSTTFYYEKAGEMADLLAGR